MGVVERSARGLELLRQIALMAAAALLYFGVRGLTERKEAVAFANARQLLRFEAAVAMDVERAAQDWLLDRDWLVTFFNWVYIWGHWPVIIATLAWLFARHPPEYALLRNAMFISGAIGLIIFVSYPVAPPRLLPDFVDTVTERSNSYRVLQPPGLVNKYAAMPSLHFGWNLLVGVMIHRVARSRFTEVYAVLGPALMALAVVLTANHFVVDAIVGGVVALCGLGAAIAIGRDRDRSSEEPAPVSERPSESAG